MDNGTTDDEGAWTSRDLPAQGAVYEVRAFNGETASKEITLDHADAFVELQLERRSPAPVLIVSNVTFDPSTITVGAEFRARFTITNNGTKGTVTATLSLLLSPRLPFGVVGSGRVLDVGELEPGGSKIVELTLSVDAHARAGTYSMPYEISYTDDNDYFYSDSGSFGIVARGTPRVQLEDFTVDPTPLTPGTTGALAIRLVNAGTDVAYDVTVTILNGDELLASTVSYIAQIGRGTNETIIFGVYVSPQIAEGKHLLNLTIAYKDSAGGSFSCQETIDLDISAVEPIVPSYYYIIALAVFLAAVGIYVSFKKMGIDLW